MEHPIFISTEELQVLLDNNSVQIIDSGKDHKEAFLAGHIPTAVFFNVNEIRNRASPLPAEAPCPEEFVEYMIELGIKANVTTVVYDLTGFAMAGRPWYLLKHYGARNVKMLNGGLPKWRSEGRAIETGEMRKKNEAVNRDDYRYSLGLDDRLHFDEVVKLVESIKASKTTTKIWDSRPPDLYKIGAIDTTINVPIGTFFNEDKTVKTEEEVREIIRSRVGSDTIVVACLKGFFSNLSYLLLTYIGHRDRWIYTGSYDEWRYKFNL